ncbi:hypothetical protein K9N68_21365 [Kovacikia minuta CCNUW1]|uniref:DUF6887 family protein n=1 Tax=Kovacikia minuta TaxID=2931930 RepID=UPI001CCA575C|nr:hypothetical protein [Kovacikia minuta]UBF24251.1 hypothetical protein K9N68_21365 [Kovacikia minuta CCNUW1]
MKPDFKAMTRKELLAYMLAHRDDDDAFHELMDKVYAEPRRESYPAPKSIDDLKNFPELLEKFHQEREKRS